MYSLDHWKLEMDTYLGADDPKYNRQDTFTLFEVSDLYHNFMPDPTDEVFLDERKVAYSTKINEFKRRVMGAIATKSFDANGIGEVDGITLMNRQAIAEFFKYIGEPCPKVFQPRTSDTVLPCYLDPNDKYYCPELALAIKVCDAIYIDKKGNQRKSVTTRISDLLEKQYAGPNGDRLPGAFLDRMTAICNSKPVKFHKKP